MGADAIPPSFLHRLRTCSSGPFLTISAMSAELGPFSRDRQWVWNGTEWVTTRSPDGYWRWNGRGWVAARSPWRMTLEPSWRRSDSVRLVAWLTIWPMLLGGTVALVGVLASLSERSWVLAAVGAYLVWAGIGGVLVRPDGRCGEVLVGAAILVSVLVVVYVCATLYPDVVGNGDQQADHVAAVGSILVVAIAFPPTVAAGAVGRGIARVVRFRQSSARL